MKYEESNLHAMNAAIDSSGPKGTLRSLLPYLIVTKLGSPQRIESTLLAGEGLLADYNSIYVVDGGKRLRDYVDDEEGTNKDLDTELERGTVVAVSFPPDDSMETSYSVVNPQEFLEELQKACQLILDFDVLVDKEDRSSLAQIAKGLAVGTK